MNRVILRLTGLASALIASPAFACTLCYSRTARNVRDVVLGPDFFANAAALSMPVPLLLATIALALRLTP